MDLTKAQRNEIFRAVAAGGLDLADCELTHYAGSTVSGITHIPTGSWIQAWTDSEGYYYSRRIGSDPQDRFASPVSFWDKLLAEITQWSYDVTEWERIPDFWEVRHDWRLLSDPQQQDTINTPFTAEDQETISAQLAAIRESVKKACELTAEQEAKINAQFEEAEKASRRLGRKDWILLFAGGVFSLILTDIITPGIAQHILTMATHGLEHLFMTGPGSIEAE
jgi:hypothetical protein